MPIVRRIRKNRDRRKIDWRRIDRTTDAEIRRQIAADPDTAPEIGPFDGFERDPRFLRRIRQARQSLRAGRGVKLQDLD
jgi:hypothetical protein